MKELIFLSSTLRDLATERKAVFDTFNAQYGVFAFEHRSISIPKNALEVIRQKIKECAFFVLVIGESSGTPLDPLDVRITQAEWKTALAYNKNIFVFEKDIVVTDTNLIKFREEVRFHHIPAKFKTTDELIEGISASIREHIISLEKSREALEHLILPDLIAILKEYETRDKDSAVKYYEKMLNYPANPYISEIKDQLSKTSMLHTKKTRIKKTSPPKKNN